jgi:diguanylate cyclase (GGDEF)-like protein
MGLPIQLQGEVTGMIGLANKFSNYTEEDADFLIPLRDALAGLFYAVELEKARLEAEDQFLKMAMTDTLSGLNNRRAFIEYLSSLPTDDATYFAMIDIDYFKSINDRFGHDIGDEVIRLLGTLLINTIDASHFTARIGGEEFAIVLNGLTNELATQELTTLMDVIRNTDFSLPDNSAVTISIGIAPLLNSDTSNTLSKADKALYTAKENGRNRIEWYAEK